MSDPFLGELKLMSFSFPPKGWALCHGQLLPISQNQALFALLGTNFGGNGQTTFALPDLRGRAPLHRGIGIALGDKAGQEAVTLPSQMPAHSHALSGTSDLANASVPGGALPAAKGRGGMSRYAPAGGTVPMGSSSLAATGGGQPHDNMQPFLALNWCIALQGIFPSRN
jgi:microcystin-dependent protein